MSEYLIYYTESNIVCLVIFSIILIHDLFNIDRQEKQIKYDHALIAFMCYFISDAFWAMVIDGLIPKTAFSVAAVNFANYFFMAAITYTWLIYVMAFEQTPRRNEPLRKVAVAFPFMLTTVALIIVYIFAPSLLFDESLDLKPLYNVFLIAVPIIYVTAVLFYTMRKAYWESNPIEKRKHIYLGAMPLLVVAGGLLQVIALPDTPIFCFSCAILMLIFNIISMETSISLDPLTGLNNRSHLMRLVSQKNALLTEGRHTFVVMIDINDFKTVNDTYGHAEGDTALVIVANSMKKVAVDDNQVIFLGRYGGDEFIMIIQSGSHAEVEGIIERIKERIAVECDARRTPYILTVGAGYDELTNDIDSFKSCMQNADSKMYLDKERCKKNGRSTVIRRTADHPVDV